MQTSSRRVVMTFRGPMWLLMATLRGAAPKETK